jgi:hypothetical protein
MDKIQTSNRSLDTLAWGAFFLWWGITELFGSLPEGVGAISFGLILLGLNLIRSMKGIPKSGFTTILGILALVWGGLELAGAVLSLPFDLPLLQSCCHAGRAPAGRRNLRGSRQVGLCLAIGHSFSFSGQHLVV